MAASHLVTQGQKFNLDSETLQCEQLTEIPQPNTLRNVQGKEKPGAASPLCPWPQQPAQPALAVLQCKETRGLHLLAPSCPYSRMVLFVILFSFFFKFQGFLGLQGGGGGRGGYFFVCSFVVVLFYIDILGE